MRTHWPAAARAFREAATGRAHVLLCHVVASPRGLRRSPNAPPLHCVPWLYLQTAGYSTAVHEDEVLRFISPSSHWRRSRPFRSDPMRFDPIRSVGYRLHPPSRCHLAPLGLAPRGDPLGQDEAEKGKGITRSICGYTFVVGFEEGKTSPLSLQIRTPFLNLRVQDGVISSSTP